VVSINLCIGEQSKRAPEKNLLQGKKGKEEWKTVPTVYLSIKQLVGK
jgi:hypothetical protein